MSHKSLPTRLLTAMMATGLMLATTSALAQSGSAQQERRAERAKRGAEAPAKRYPEATRQEPEARPSRSGASRLNKLYDAYEAQDVAQTQVLADEIIGDEKSSAYDKAMAARIAGALLIGQDDAKAMDYLQRALQFDGLGNNDHYEVMNIVAQLYALEIGRASCRERV